MPLMVVCNPLLQADCEGPDPHLLRHLLRHTDIGAPYLVRSCHVHASEQVWINLVLWMRATGIRTRCHASQTQDTHQTLNTFAVDLITGLTQMYNHFATTIERVERIFGINQRK